MNANQQQAVLSALIQASTTLAAAAQVLGGSGGAGGNITVPALYLDFLPKEWQDRPRDYFTYAPTDIAALAPGAATTASFSVQQDSGFLFTGLAGHVVDSTLKTIVADPMLSISILDAGSGRQLQNRALHWQNTVGTSQLPYFLPYPKWFKPTSDVTVSYVSLVPAGGATYQIFLDFIGFKVFGIGD